MGGQGAARAVVFAWGAAEHVAGAAADRGEPDNACTSCHRAQCDTRLAVPLGELVMPAPFTDSAVRDDDASDLDELRAWCESLPDATGQGSQDAACEDALECAYRCGSDEDCARACGEARLQGEHAAAFQALLTCMVSAGCGFNEGCLDDSCSDAFGAFDLLCSR